MKQPVMQHCDRIDLRQFNIHLKVPGKLVLKDHFRWRHGTS